jgi:Flp pilus assembly pilin Flp
MLCRIRTNTSGSTSIEYALLASGLSLMGISLFEGVYASAFSTVMALSEAMGGGFTLVVLPH